MNGPFVAGEVYTFTYTLAGGANIGRTDQLGTQTGPSGIITTTTVDTVTSTGSASPFIQGLILIAGNGIGTYSVMVRCNAPGGGAVSTPTNSQIIDQVRQTFSRLGAQASSQAMGDATADAIGDAFSGTGTTQVSNGRVSFSAASLENAQASADGAQAIDALAYRSPGRGPSAPQNFTRAADPLIARTPWHVWFDGRFTGFNDKTVSSFDGWHDNATAGASYKFTDRFLVGLLVGYENFRYGLANNGIGGSAALKGDGVSGGGYFGWKFWDRMRLDGMVSYGRINYAADSGPVTSSFGADRVTGMMKLSGRYGVGWGWVEPSSNVTLAAENQDGFTDTAGGLHSTYSFLVGRSSTGALVGIPLIADLCVITPTVGAYADYRFGDQTVAALSSVPTFDNGFSAHVTAGLNVAMPGGVTASLGGEYGGLGQNVEYWRARGSIGVKF